MNPILSDLSVFFSDFAVDARTDKETGQVILDIPDELHLGDAVVASTPTIRFKRGDFKQLRNGSSINVAGTWFRVTSPPRAQDDGAIMVAEIVKK